MRMTGNISMERLARGPRTGYDWPSALLIQIEITGQPCSLPLIGARRHTTGLLQTRSDNRQMANMSSTSNGVTARSAEEVALAVASGLPIGPYVIIGKLPLVGAEPHYRARSESGVIRAVLVSQIREFAPKGGGGDAG
jgi:hypothetical protein